MLVAALSPDASLLFAVWLLMIGGVIGSFLNVVIYRLPAEMSLVHPGSHCPACNQPIRWYDNVPILSWLVLRGRCRDCGARISARYPFVEGTTALLFLVLGVGECLSGGANLPAPVVEFAGACEIYAYHLLLLCTLLAAALIAYDGHRLPGRLFIPALALGLAAPLVWPRLRPVPAGFELSGWAAGMGDGMAGLGAGLLAGWVASRLCRPTDQTGMILGPGCVGLFLGWQAAVVLTVVTVAVHLPLRASSRLLRRFARVPPTAWLWLATLGWILAWEPLVRLANGPMESLPYD